MSADLVNAPPHYTFGGIETIDFIEAKLTPEEFAGFCKGNMLKYVARAGAATVLDLRSPDCLWVLLSPRLQNVYVTADKTSKG